LDLTVSGTNFVSGATVELSDSNLQVNSVTVSSCTELVVNVTIATGAATGAIDLDVVNPDQVFGSGAAVFSVEALTPPSIVTAPQSVTVTEGRSVTFSVVANGAAPLSYQWKKNGVDVGGANDSSYTLDRASLQNDGDAFTCEVSNTAATTESAAAILTVDPTGARVDDDLVLLYTFEEGQGATVSDRSGVGPFLDLTIADTAAVSWIESGLSVNASTVLDSGLAATKVVDAVQATDEITIEAWVKPAGNSQTGARSIVTLAAPDRSARDFTLAQVADAYDVRVRTTTTSQQGDPSLLGGSATTRVTHVVFTRSASGLERLFVDGVEEVSRTVGGDFSSWIDTFDLLVANEGTGDRAWLGELNLVAVYDRALGLSEIDQNFVAGPYAAAPPANLPPTATFTATPTSGEVPLTVDFDASGSSDADGSVVSYTWEFGDGGSSSGVSASHLYTSTGTYTATLTVVDDRGGTDTTSRTITVNEPGPAPPGTVSNFRRTDVIGNN
jgi:PKD repeat protein